MNAYCPDCETELDQRTGICPACRWDPYAASLRSTAQPRAPEMSLTERYRGTQYDLHAEFVDDRLASDSRGRAFVLIGLAAASGLSAITLGALGVIG